MSLIDDALSPREVEEAIKRELPGFESRVLLQDGPDRMLRVEARGPVWFYGKAEVDPYTLPLPLNEAREVFGEYVYKMIQETRAHAIEQLGLDKEIKRQVEEKTAQAVAEAKGRWEQEGWRKGYDAAYAAATRNFAETLLEQLRPEGGQE